MELKDFEYNLIDHLYEYDGLWERKAKCGLKVANNLVIATDLYDGNPGGSITEYCAELAMIICKEYNIDLKQLMFVHHTPEVDSRYEFFEEVFYKVSFAMENDEIKNPDWNQVDRQVIVELVNSSK